MIWSPIISTPHIYQAGFRDSKYYCWGIVLFNVTATGSTSSAEILEILDIFLDLSIALQPFHLRIDQCQLLL